MEAGGRGEGQGAAPGLAPGQGSGVRLTAGQPSSAPLPHQGPGWGVFVAPGLLELWREREGGERRFPGSQSQRREKRGKADGDGGRRRKGRSGV